MRKSLGVMAVLALAGGGLVVSHASPAPAASAVTVQLAGTASPTTGAFDAGTAVSDAEFVGEADGEESPDAFKGVITDRSLSRGSGNGPSVSSGKKAKSNAVPGISFEGLNLYQQRYARGGNQFTVEPPDQAMCAGNGFVLEATNDVLNVFDSAGHSVLPDNTASNIVSLAPRNVNHAVDLNSFYGYAPAINRVTGVRAQNITDPTCIFDVATQRFYLVVLTLESRPNGQLTRQNHLDLAVSQSANPTGPWNIYKLDVTGDGTNTGGVNPGPYLGDYPHIGADANGVYITTNAYPWLANGFAGAQIYAFSKAQLAAGAANVNVVHLDTSGMVNLPSDAGPTQPGFTVWPAQSPGTQYNTDDGGTEFFLSSNAADEATHPVAGSGGNYASNQLIVWSLKNTSSLSSASPALTLSTKVVPVNTYAIAPKQHQPGSGTPPTVDTPLGHCINDTTTATIAGLGCWRLLFRVQPAHNETIATMDANDTRMQQVTYANGKLWGALDTALNPDGGAQRAGIGWYVINPNSGKVAIQGYLGASGYDITYPAIAVTESGRGVMGFSVTGDNLNPSAGYASIDAKVGVSAWDVVPGAEGAAPFDGFTSYKALVGNPPRTRFGDYGAAAVDGESIWLASEYVASACTSAQWGGPFFAGGSGDNLLGTCAGSTSGTGKRTALGNWSTRVSKFTP